MPTPREPTVQEVIDYANWLAAQIEAATDIPPTGYVARWNACVAWLRANTTLDLPSYVIAPQNW